MEKKAPVEKKAKVDPSTSEPGPSASEETTAATKLKPIEIGDSLPAGLVLKNEKDEDFDVSSVTADKGVIIFLVPKANTSAFSLLLSTDVMCPPSVSKPRRCERIADYCDILRCKLRP